MQVHLVIHVFQGVLSDARAFYTEDAANKYEEELCKQNKIPYNLDERQKYYEENEVDDDISRRDVEVE